MPRELTAEIRRDLGLPNLRVEPPRWGLTAVIVSIACVPLLLLGWYAVAAAVVLGAFVVLPAVRWVERRELDLRERVYREGCEVFARVTDVEPGNQARRDRLVRIEFSVDGRTIKAAVPDSYLARRGLAPGEVVRVVHAPDDPRRCLILARAPRDVLGPEHEDEVEVPTGGGCGGCGSHGSAGGCGSGGCGSHGSAGGCGSGGCGSEGCGSHGSGGCGGHGSGGCGGCG